MYVVHCQWGGQKRMSDSLEMEVQMIVNHHVAVGYPTHVLCKKTKCSSPLSLFSSPTVFIVQMNMNSIRSRPKWLPWDQMHTSCGAGVVARRESVCQESMTTECRFLPPTGNPSTEARISPQHSGGRLVKVTRCFIITLLIMKNCFIRLN